MLEELLGLGGGILSSIINGNAQQKRYKQMLRHLREVEAWQKNNLAQGIGALAGGRQAYLNDPRRATELSGWQNLMANPSAMTPEFVSTQKQAALSGAATQAGAADRRLSAVGQAQGLGSSPYLAAIRAANYARSGRDALDISAGIDTKAAVQRKSDEKSVLSGYSDWLSHDQETQYGFSRDIASLLGGIQYGSSLGMTG